jgi:hypothetical protein
MAADLSTPNLERMAKNVRRWPTGHFDDSVSKIELIEEILWLRSQMRKDEAA